MGLFSKLFAGAEEPALVAEPKIGAHIAFDGAIRVLEAPAGEGWRDDEIKRRGEGFKVIALKYVSNDAPVPLALAAKLYTHDPERPPPPPLERDWPALFQAMFAAPPIVTTRPGRLRTPARELAAVEVVLEGTGATPPGPLRVRERRAVVGREELVVTAFGPPSAFAAHERDVDAWFETAVFTPRSEAEGAPPDADD